MRPISLAGLLLSAALSVHADEGMWLFNKPPVRQVKEKYGFEITPEWLEDLQKSSVRFGNGGSGSFASANGLILTNHHVGSGMIEKLSTPERDLLKNGFYAKTAEEELKCPDLELNVLMSIEDVTERVNAAVDPKASPEEASKKRRIAIGEIEKESDEKTGLRSDLVTLYQGGAYHLYRYHRYTDVRLVFAPDVKAAAFGGDPDNFEFPRFCLDYCFFRAYENGAPAKTPHFLKWNPAGAAEGDLIFTSGHPGRTNRLVTLAQLESMRDDSFPYRLEQIFRSEAMMRAWSDRDLENARRAKGAITGTQNGRKAMVARLNGLLDPAFMARKAEEETKMRESFRQKEEWKNADAAFSRITKAKKSSKEMEARLRMFEGGDAFGTQLFGIARTLLRAGDQRLLSDKARLPEFQEKERVSLELDLFSDEPVYKNFEAVKMTNALTFLCAKLGATDPLVKKILAGKSPAARASELVMGTGLEDVALRRKLYEGGRDAVTQANDPMIELARIVDDEALHLRQEGEAADEEIEQAHQSISKARFALLGDSTYPDATFSLRLSYGTVKGYGDESGAVPFQTTFEGLQQRHDAQGKVAPFDFSKEWETCSSSLDPKTPLNFVSTNDITGGNSGSPVVNRKGELIGLVFDTNAPGLVSDFAYTDERGRCVSVHPAGIIESLRKIYQAERILGELAL
jgi:hypothetical protein